MDGYAIRAADTLAASEDAPVQLEVVGDIAAGASPEVSVTPGSAVRDRDGRESSHRAPMLSSRSRPRRRSMPPVDSGRAGVMPPGRCRLPASSTSESSWAPRCGATGSDLTAGRDAPRTARASRAAVVALVAGAGVADIVVHRRPRIGRARHGRRGAGAAGTDLGPAGIPDADGPGLRALVTASGGEPIDLGIARTDDLDDVLDSSSTRVSTPVPTR